MKIAIIGSGNVGSALAAQWIKKGHSVVYGVRDTSNFKGKENASSLGIGVMNTVDAVKAAEVIVLATPATAAVEVAQSLGDTTGKVIIDTMNTVMGRGPTGFDNTSDAILANTNNAEVVKCFNTTGYNNMQAPVYGDQALDAFVAGNSTRGKAIATQLALDAGFGACYDVGGNDKFSLMEQFAFFWINLAMFQGQGREIGFKLLKR